jgi:cytoskeleton protein RodZ
MSTEGMQEALFQDPIGMRLRAARTQAGLSVEQAGQQLRLPVAIIEAMEREDWARLGAPIYVRSYLGSYLRLVGLPGTLAERVATTKPAPALVTMASRSRMRRTFDRSVRNLVYLVMTAVLVVPVVLVARHYQAAERAPSLTLDTDPASLPPAVAEPAAPGTAPEALVAAPATPAEPAAPAANDAGPDPVMASMAPFQKQAPAVADAADGLLLRFTGQSWIDVTDASGARVERGLVDAGAERRYAPGQVAHITLGNAEAVQVLHGGEPVDLAPYRAANVARFTVSSSGEPAPARH